MGILGTFRHGEPYSRVGILHRYTTLQLQFQKQFTLHCHPTVVSELQGTLHFHPTVVLVVVQVSLLNCRVPYNNISESRLQGTQQPTFVKQVVGCLRNYTTSIVVLCCVGSMQGSPSLLLSFLALTFGCLKERSSSSHNCCFTSEKIQLLLFFLCCLRTIRFLCHKRCIL